MRYKKNSPTFDLLCGWHKFMHWKHGIQGHKNGPKDMWAKGCWRVRGWRWQLWWTCSLYDTIPERKKHKPWIILNQWPSFNCNLLSRVGRSTCPDTINSSCVRPFWRQICVPSRESMSLWYAGAHMEHTYSRCGCTNDTQTRCGATKTYHCWGFLNI